MLTDARLKPSETKLKLLSVALIAAGGLATTFGPSSMSLSSLIDAASAFISIDARGVRLTRL